MSYYDDIVLTDSPWGYWKLDETSGAPQDSSGNGRHFALSSSGSVTYNNDPIYPGTARCINILAATQRWTRAGLGNAPGTTRSMECWIDRTGASSGSGAYFFGEQVGASGQSRQWMLEKSSATSFTLNGAGEGANGSDRQIGFGWTVPSSAVHFVTVWYADNSCTLYADGVAINNQSTPYRSNNTGNLFIGRPPDTFWGQMYGRMANFAIYTSALSAERIWEHYASVALWVDSNSPMVMG